MLSRLFRRWFHSPKQTNFVSELDTFMADVRAKTPLSASQQREIAKAQVVANKRDNKLAANDTKLWSEF